MHSAFKFQSQMHVTKFLIITTVPVPSWAVTKHLKNELTLLIIS